MGRPACASEVEVAASAVPGAVVAGMVPERSTACMAASASDDRPDYRTAVDARNLSGSQSAGTELLSLQRKQLPQAVQAEKTLSLSAKDMVCCVARHHVEEKRWSLAQSHRRYLCVKENGM